MNKKPEAKQPVEHTRRFICAKCEFDTGDGKELITHIVQSHGYAEENVKSAKGGLTCALDGDEYHNVFEYSVDGEKLIIKVEHGPKMRM